VASAAARAIEKAGVVGAGGGGFPTHVKAASDADVVLANGAECEPLLRADSELLISDAARVIEGLRIIRESVGASRAVIALKAKNVTAIEAVEKALPEDGAIEIKRLENVYPAGDEYLLVYDCTGRVIPEGGIPLDVGVVVNNVTTLAQIADALDGRPVTDRLVSVQGEIAHPATFRVPIGTAIGDVLELAGGIAGDASVLIGGPMMGRVASDLSEPVTKTVAGLIALPSDHRMITVRAGTRSSVLRLARAACCQCLACTELCPRALLGHDLAPHRTVRAVQYDTLPADHAHVTSAFLCCECGMCELFACPLEIQPRRILADLKAELVRRGVENPHRRQDLSPDDVREYRQIPSARLVQRLGLAPYNGPAPLDSRTVAPRRVVLRLAAHTGAPAQAVVSPGDRVLRGDLVAEIPKGKLGARVHASIDGTIAEVTPEEVVATA
jgi:Na+-translocating ferredoxin:NAD+ oxidoreductase RnfC subunit